MRGCAGLASNRDRAGAERGPDEEIGSRWAGPGTGWFACEGDGRVQSDAGALSWALAGRALCCNGEHRRGGLSQCGKVMFKCLRGVIFKRSGEPWQEKKGDYNLPGVWLWSVG